MQGGENMYAEIIPGAVMTQTRGLEIKRGIR